jgi:uncharacterized YigZ family protein
LTPSATPLHYFTIEKSGTAEYKDRGSRFIAYAYPIANTEEFKQHLQALKVLHPKANHHCFAYRIGTDGNNFRSSDDGEPAGSAGKPILGQIDSRGVVNVAVIVVRYFGGSLLGVPGLINAYKTVTALALQVIPVVQKPVERLYRLQFDYNSINPVLLLLRQFNCSILEQDLQLFCSIKAGVPVNRVEEIVYRLEEIKGMELTKLS